MKKNKILRYLSISAFVATLPIPSLFADWSMTEDFTATTDTAVDQQVYDSEDTFTGSFTLTGNGYSIIATDADISGVRPSGWVASAVITGVGDISNLDMYEQDGSLKYDSQTGNIIANEEGFVGLSCAISVNGYVTLSDSIIMNGLSNSGQNDYSSGLKTQSAFYVTNCYFINNDVSNAVRVNNAVNGSYIASSYFYGNLTAVSFTSKGTSYYDNYVYISESDFQYNNTSLSVEGIKASLTESTFTNNIDSATLITMKTNALLDATDVSFEDNAVYNGFYVASGSTLNLTSAYIADNTAENSLVYVTGVSTSDGYGTADVVSSATLNLTSSTIENNTVGYGIFVNSGGQAYVSNSTFTGNSTATDSTKSFFNITGSTTSTLSDESTITSSSYLNLDNVKFTNNEGVYNAIYSALGASVDVSNSTVTGNTFTNTFIYAISGSSVDILDTTVSNNSYTNSFFYISGTSDATTTATISNLTYENNSGTGIEMAAYSDVTIKDSTFSNNGDTTLKEGSVVQATGGTLTLDNVVVTDNLSVNGAINTTGTYVTITDSEFTGNSGTWGGVMRVQNATITDTLFQDNVNTGSGLSGAVLYFKATVSGLTDNVVTFKIEDVDMKYSGNVAGSSGFANIITQSEEDALAAGDDAVSATLAFDISEGRTLEIGNYTVASDEIRSDGSAYENQTIEKNGDGTLIINSSMQYYYGDLDVNAGSMYVNKMIGAEVISIAEDSMLAIRVGTSVTTYNRTFANSTSTTINNSGTLIVAGEAGINSYSKALVKDGATLSISGDGTLIVYGGVIDYDAYTYTASSATTVSVLGSINSTSIVQNGIIRYNNSDGNVALDIQFNSASDFTMSMLEGIDVSNNALVEEAYKLYTSGLSDTDSALISFLIDDTTLSITDLQIYRMESNEWVVVDDSLDYLQYDGQYLSFITDDFSTAFGWGYATVVPEPSTYAAIAGALALGLAMYRRRK